MIIVKVVIFSFMVMSVKIMFVLFFQEEDEKLYRMKEAADFIEFLRIYSCTMKFPLKEIILKYNFKYQSAKNIFSKLLSSLEQEEENKCSLEEYENYINNEMQSPKEFNMKLCNIIEFYGTSFSDVLNKKLIFTKNDLDKYINEYEYTYKEKKGLLNKLALLIGCLIAIVLI